MSETTFAQAFNRAHWGDAEERLRTIVVDAMIAHSTDRFATIDAVWAKVRINPELVSYVFRFDYRRFVGVSLDQITREILHAQQGDRKQSAKEKRAAKVAREIVAEEKQLEAERLAEIRRAEREEQARRDREYSEYLASWKATQIGSIFVNEKPVWECSAPTIRAWLPTQRRRLRVIELLLEGVPDDDRPLEYYRRPDEVEALLKVIDNE